MIETWLALNVLLLGGSGTCELGSGICQAFGHVLVSARAAREPRGGLKSAPVAPAAAGASVLVGQQETGTALVCGGS